MHSKRKNLKIGILSWEQYKQRTIAIAKGEYKRKADEPKIWFTSIEVAERVLSENQEFWNLMKRS